MRAQGRAAVRSRGEARAAPGVACTRARSAAQLRRGGTVTAAAAASAQTGLIGCRLAGVGSSVPTTVLSNSDLERFVETNDEWIATRTGIKRRHVLAEGETMGPHAVAAGKRALEMAGVAPEELGIVLMATSTPDDAFGSACQVSPLCRLLRSHSRLQAAFYALCSTAERCIR